MGVINYTANSSAFVKPIGVPGQPTAFESYYFDEVTKKSRPYQSTTELLAYLNTSQSRMGHKTLYVRVGSVLVGGELTGGELREFWFKDGVANSDLVEKNAVLPPVPAWVTLTGGEWNVTKNRRVIINLTKDLTTINTEDFPAGVLAEAFVKQPATGGKRLMIDNKEVTLNTAGGRLIGDTRLILEYIGGDLVISADPNAISTKPVLDTQTGNATALPGSTDTLFYAKFLDLGRTLDYRWKLNGAVPKLADGKTDKHTGQSILMEGIPENVGSWECTAIDRITGLETPSAPMVFRLGDPEPVFVIAGPSDMTVNAGEPFELVAQFGGTPPPEVKCIEVTGQDGDGIPTGPVVANGNRFAGVALYTKDYAFIGSNTIIEMVEKTPAVLQDGYIVTPAVYENRKTVYKKATEVVTVTPIKQAQPAPAAFAAYNDITDEITLANVPSGKTLSDYRVVIDGDDPIIPASLVVAVGDRDVPVGRVSAYWRETDIYSQSPAVTSTAPFNKIPSLQPADPRNSKGLIDNVAIVGTAPNIIHTEGSENRAGMSWTNNWVLTTRKAVSGAEVYIETLVDFANNHDFYYGFKTSPTLGSIDDFFIAFGVSQFGDIGVQSKQAGNTGIGKVLNGDLVRLYRLSNGTFRLDLVRSGSVAYTGVISGVSSSADLFVCLNLREDTNGSIKNPMTYGLSAV